MNGAPVVVHSDGSGGQSSPSWMVRAALHRLQPWKARPRERVRRVRGRMPRSAARGRGRLANPDTRRHRTGRRSRRQAIEVGRRSSTMSIRKLGLASVTAALAISVAAGTIAAADPTAGQPVNQSATLAARDRRQLARLPPQRGADRLRPGLPGAGHAHQGLVGEPRRRRVRPADRRRRNDLRRDRERHRLRARPGERRRPVAAPPGHAGPALDAALRQHRPARDHQHHGLRCGDRLDLRVGGAGRPEAHACSPSTRRRARSAGREASTSPARRRGPTSSAAPWRSPTATSTSASAASPATAASTRARWSASGPNGTGSRIVYRVPVAREGAIWSTGGPVIDSKGNVYVSVGNGSSTTTYDGSDSVLKLSPALKLKSRFAPSRWRTDNAHDQDLGSLSPVLVPGGWVVHRRQGRHRLRPPPERPRRDRRPGVVEDRLQGVRGCGADRRRPVHPLHHRHPAGLDQRQGEDLPRLAHGRPARTARP